MRFEIRYFFLEFGLSPKGLTQSQEKKDIISNLVYTFAFHRLACATIQYVLYYMSETVQYTFDSHTFEGMGSGGVSPKILFWKNPLNQNIL